MCTNMVARTRVEPSKEAARFLQSPCSPRLACGALCYMKTLGSTKQALHEGCCASGLLPLCPIYTGKLTGGYRALTTRARVWPLWRGASHWLMHLCFLEQTPLNLCTDTGLSQGRDKTGSCLHKTESLLILPRGRSIPAPDLHSSNTAQCLQNLCTDTEQSLEWVWSGAARGPHHHCIISASSLDEYDCIFTTFSTRYNLEED